MDKSKYYVSVQAGTILPDKGAAAYEFEIEASHEEINKLRELMDEQTDADNAAYWRAHVPVIPYHYDSENDIYDEYLRNIYQKIYELGTEETKRQMEESNLLALLNGAQQEGKQE
jgi:putative cell wall-binding protein